MIGVHTGSGTLQAMRTLISCQFTHTFCDFITHIKDVHLEKKQTCNKVISYNEVRAADESADTFIARSYLVCKD